jgi:hypothetical protein
MATIMDANEGCDIFIDEQVGNLLYHIANLDWCFFYSAIASYLKAFVPCVIL